MDNLTHTLVGVGLANAGLSKRYGRAALWVLMVSSNLPDVDAIWAMIRGGDAYLSRRMLTHSFLGVPLLALACAALFHLRYKNLSFTTLFLLSLLGAGLHIAFDFVNSYGVVFCYPVSWKRFELAWVFIIDLAIWGILMAPFLAPQRFQRQGPWMASLAVLSLYLTFCGFSRFLAQRALNAIVREKNLAPTLVYSFPEALGPHRFRGVIKTGNEYQFYLIHTLSGRAELKEVVVSDDEAPEVIEARQTAPAKRLDWFFKAPVWTVGARDASGTEVQAYDLRFRSLVIGRRIPFVYHFRVSPDGVIYQGRRG